MTKTFSNLMTEVKISKRGASRLGKAIVAGVEADKKLTNDVRSAQRDLERPGREAMSDAFSMTHRNKMKDELHTHLTGMGFNKVGGGSRMKSWGGDTRDYATYVGTNPKTGHTHMIDVSHRSKPISSWDHNLDIRHVSSAGWSGGDNYNPTSYGGGTDLNRDEDAKQASSRQNVLKGITQRWERED